jgi:hypothetical protein
MFSTLSFGVNSGFAIPAAFLFCCGLMEGIVWASDARENIAK